MTDSIIENYNQLRQKVVEDDRRFQQKDGHLCFEGVDLDALARKYPTPFMFSLNQKLFVISKRSNRHLPHIKIQKLFLHQKPVPSWGY